ncbi:MAG: hypothetical protein ACREOF_19845 [Gemmatimonadales bacterium]
MAGASFEGRRLVLGLAVFSLGCGSGGSLEGGFIGVPWKARSAQAPLADSATTTALATGQPGAIGESAGRASKRTRRAPRLSAPLPGSAAETTTAPTPAPPIVLASRLESTLLRLRELERRHHRLTGSYSAHPSRLGLPADPGMELRVVWASPWGWAAIARDSAHSVPACAIYMGTVPSTQSSDGRVGSARPGTPACIDTGEQPSRMLHQVLTLADNPPSADQGLMSLMRADLMNLATSQRQYRAVQGTFSRTTRVLAVHYSWSSGVALHILSANSRGWSGEATYDQLPGKSCVIYGGRVAEVPTTEEQGLAPEREGTVVCDE